MISTKMPPTNDMPHHTLNKDSTPAQNSTWEYYKSDTTFSNITPSTTSTITPVKKMNNIKNS